MAKQAMLVVVMTAIGWLIARVRRRVCADDRKRIDAALHRHRSHRRKDLRIDSGDAEIETYEKEAAHSFFGEIQDRWTTLAAARSCRHPQRFCGGKFYDT